MADLKNILSWSISRNETLNYCSRKYYLTYYEHWNGWDADAPKRKKLAYFLKKRDPVAVWLGNTIHNAIKYTIQNVASVNQEFILKSLKQRLNTDFTSSANRTHENGKVKDLWLYEHYRGIAIDYSPIEEKAIESINNFFESETYIELKSAKGALDILYLDSDDFDLMKFYFDGIMIYAMPDLCFKSQDGTIKLIDWKTGHAKDDDLSNQLKAYSLRLLLQNGLDLSKVNISAYSSYLIEKTLMGRNITMEDIEEIKIYIHESYLKMEELLIDITNNIPKGEEFFPKTESINKCKQCVFFEICHEDI